LMASRPVPKADRPGTFGIVRTAKIGP
jgi:hypothetical protein